MEGSVINGNFKQQPTKWSMTLLEGGVCNCKSQWLGTTQVSNVFWTWQNHCLHDFNNRNSLSTKDLHKIKPVNVLEWKAGGIGSPLLDEDLQPDNGFCSRESECYWKVRPVVSWLLYDHEFIDCTNWTWKVLFLKGGYEVRLRRCEVVSRMNYIEE